MGNLNIPEKEDNRKNDEDTKESEPLCRDGHFGSGFTISCFCSTYALQLYSVLWNNNSENT